MKGAAVPKLKPEFVPVNQLSEVDIEAIVQIGRAQAALMNELEHALEADDDTHALGVARKLVRLEKKVREQ
jgi:hypothetical protein